MIGQRATFIGGDGLTVTCWSPKLRVYAVGIALLLPGSFFVLPLLWLWRRRATRLPAAARAHAPRLQPEFAGRRSPDPAAE